MTCQTKHRVHACLLHPCSSHPLFSGAISLTTPYISRAISLPTLFISQSDHHGPARRYCLVNFVSDFVLSLLLPSHLARRALFSNVNIVQTLTISTNVMVGTHMAQTVSLPTCLSLLPCRWSMTLSCTWCWAHPRGPGRRVARPPCPHSSCRRCAPSLTGAEVHGLAQCLRRCMPHAGLWHGFSCTPFDMGSKPFKCVPVKLNDVTMVNVCVTLSRYLTARGMRPMLDAEWSVYSESALQRFQEGRLSHEAALRSQGHSTFYNSRVGVLRPYISLKP